MFWLDFRRVVIVKAAAVVQKDNAHFVLFVGIQFIFLSCVSLPSFLTMIHRWKYPTDFYHPAQIPFLSKAMLSFRIFHYCRKWTTHFVSRFIFVSWIFCCCGSLSSLFCYFFGFSPIPSICCCPFKFCSFCCGSPSISIRTGWVCGLCAVGTNLFLFRFVCVANDDYQ